MTAKLLQMPKNDQPEWPIAGYICIGFTAIARHHLSVIAQRHKIQNPESDEAGQKVMKDALRFFDWYLGKKEEGYSLVIEKDNELRVVEPTF